jgi:hypothetical protein
MTRRTILFFLALLALAGLSPTSAAADPAHSEQMLCVSDIIYEVVALRAPVAESPGGGTIFFVSRGVCSFDERHPS